MENLVIVAHVQYKPENIDMIVPEKDQKKSGDPKIMEYNRINLKTTMVAANKAGYRPVEIYVVDKSVYGKNGYKLIVKYSYEPEKSIKVSKEIRETILNRAWQGARVYENTDGTTSINCMGLISIKNVSDNVDDKCIIKSISPKENNLEPVYCSEPTMTPKTKMENAFAALKAASA